MKRTIIPAFTQLSMTDFGPTYLEEMGIEDQVCIGFWDKSDDSWEENNLIVKWYRASGGVRMEVYDEEELSNHKTLRHLFTNSNTTPKKLREDLLNLGYQDITDFIS